MRLLALPIILFTAALSAQGTPADYERAAGLSSLVRGKVFKDRVEPNWIAGGPKFWYRLSTKTGHVFVFVDPKAAERRPAFDHAQLASRLGSAVAKKLEAEKLPISRLEYSEELQTLAFDMGKKRWSCSLKDYTCREIGKAQPAARQERRGRRSRGRRRGARGRRPSPSRTSPDGAWTAFVKDHNLFLRPAQGGDPAALTTDGTADNAYSAAVAWSPDSKKLATHRVIPAQEHLVHYVESSPSDQVQPKHSTRQYLKPGDRVRIAKPRLFDVATRQQLPVSDALFANPYRTSGIEWREDSSAFTFEYNERGHGRYKILEVDATTGEVRALIDEDPETFFDYAHKRFRHDIDDGAEILWMSERDGWNHLYRIDGESGAVKNQITKGAWVVRGVDKVDEEARQIWFRASGRNPGEDPYLIHHYRIGFDGSGLVALTDGDGNHSIQYSPDRRFLIDRFSRPDSPPVHVVRRAADGSAVMQLETADISELIKTGWRAPQPFVAKARDGKTDIWGLIYRPTNFDPKKRYPVIEDIYAGPHGNHVPKDFRASGRGRHALAELGFLVVKIDGLGTSNRSKAFHDVCWKNLKDAGLPDRILWMQAAAKVEPAMDLSRVGIFGTSAGGQSAAGAVFLHPEFYKAAYSACGCHDNRMDKIWWNELWMGYPVGPHYAESSNVTHAHKLQGKLMLAVGELDTNVDPASTMQVVNALIRAGKDFDLIVLPGGGHTSGGAYGSRRRNDFFVRHLLGVTPPDRNRQVSRTGR